MTKKQKRPILMILLFILCWNIVFAPILFVSAIHRANRILNPYIQEVKDSITINEKLGTVKKVKIKNVFNYTKKKNNHTCIEMKIITNNGKYEICTITENSFQGYIYNKKVYEEITKKSVIEIENYSNDFESELNAYRNKVIDYPKTREPIIYKTEDNRYQIINICKYKQEEECIKINEKYLGDFVDSFNDKYQINIID